MILENSHAVAKGPNGESEQCLSLSGLNAWAYIMDAMLGARALR